MPLPRTGTPLLRVVLAALLVGCSSHASGDSGAAPPTSGGPTSGPASPTGQGAGPPVPSDRPYADATPGVVSTAGGVQQVVVSGFDRFFDPEVIRVHPGKLRVILRNDDQIEVHNLVFQGRASGGSGDTAPGQANAVTVILDKPGLYDFICSYHLLVGMRGQVKVE